MVGASFVAPSKRRVILVDLVQVWNKIRQKKDGRRFAYRAHNHIPLRYVEGTSCQNCYS